MGRAAFMIDIEAIGLHPDGDHVRTQLMQHVTSNLICRPMSAINHDAQAA